MGYWLTEDKRFVISVRHCEATLCGSIYWIAPSVIPLDVKNPDPHKHAKPLCGMEVMAGFTQRDASNWIDGTIYRPSTGKSYKSTIQMLPSGKAILNGYILLPLFGHTQIMTPVSQKDYPKCKRP